MVSCNGERYHDTATRANKMATESCANKDNLHLIFGIIYLVLSPIALVGNGFILYIAKRDPLRQFNKPTNIFNNAIEIAHFLTALIVLPYIGINSILKSQHLLQESSDEANLFQDVLVGFVVSNGCVLYFAVFIERSTAFVFPVLNRKHVTMTRVRRTCMSITGICFLVSCILFTGIPKNYFYVVFLPLFILLPSFGFLLLPAAVLYALKRQALKVSVAKRNECLTCPAHNRKEKARRTSQINRYVLETLRVTFSTMIIVVFYCAVKFLEVRHAQFSTTFCCYERLEHTSYLLLFVPIALNPIILVAKIPVYWRAAKHIWNRR